MQMGKSLLMAFFTTHGENDKTKNGRAKMHAKLLCYMDWRPIELKGFIKHTKLWHEKHMEYDGMSRGVVNQDGKHQWYLMM